MIILASEKKDKLVDKHFRTSWTGWRTWGTLAIFPFFAFILQFSITLMIEPMKSEFNLNDIWIGILGASYSIFYTIMQIPLGTLVDKFGTRKITLISLTGCAFCTMLFSFSHNLETALICRLGMGFFTASSFTCAFYAAGKWFEFKTFSILVATTESLANLGGVIGTSVLAYLIINIGWRYTSLFLAALAVLILVLSVYNVKDKAEDSCQTAVSTIKTGPSIYSIMGIVLRNKHVWICGLCIGLLFAPLSSLSGLWAVPFLRAKYNMDLVEAGRIVSLSYLGAAIFSPIMAVLSNKLKKKAGIIRVFSLIMFFILIIIIYFPINNEFINALVFFLMGAITCSYVIPFAIAKKIVKQKVSATALALTNVLGGAIGALIFQPLTGFIMHIINDFSGFDKSAELFSYYFAFSVFPLSMLLLYYLAGLIKEPEA
ncbi:MAG TPA: hypothetical protein DD381_07795 [Lentisphaeria bacterium]|nr:MAG: hypothetical protein A2X47_04360 [Lentisphaerae bacterium GWF2_38_69]HBM16224.1 hypothetical protein [Lentisphaeria bacterium]